MAKIMVAPHLDGIVNHTMMDEAAKITDCIHLDVQGRKERRC